MPERVDIRRDTPSATVRIDNPGSQNALTPGIVDGLLEAWADLHGELGVRGVILTGGGQCFSSGTDLKRLATQIRQSETSMDVHQQWQDEVDKLLELITVMLRFPKPIVAAVNGIAAGTGLALALACDFVVAGESSLLGVPESRLGLMPGLAAPLLGFRAGNSVARRMTLTGESISAADARDCQIVDETVADDVVSAQANQIVTMLAQASAASQLQAKHLCNETIGESLFVQLSNGAANMAAARITDSARRGVEAFVNKRTIDWSC